MRPSRILASIVAVAFLLWTIPATASMFGEENAILAGILAQALKQSVDGAEALITVKEALTVAKESAEAARQAIQVVDNVALILENPDEFLQAEANAFLRSFPEIDAIRNDVEDVRRRLHRGPDRRYDPYAFLTVLDQLKKAKDGAYNIVVRAVDEWNVSEPLDENIENNRKKREQAGKIYGQTVDPLNPLTPQKAAVLTAQAAAISANADVATNALLTEMLRMEQIRFLEATEAGARTDAELQDLMRDPDEQPVDWRLNFGSSEGPL